MTYGKRSELQRRVTVSQEFTKMGRSASFHYADDSGKEWGQGNKDRDMCLKMYHENEDMREELEVIAKGFLWSLSMEYANYIRRNECLTK